jgi:hypothetical protein
MRRSAQITAIATLHLLAAPAAPAFAGGYVYVHRHELPAAIGKQHTCIGPRARTIMLPTSSHAGSQRLFTVACPVAAKTVVTFATRPDHPDATPQADGDEEGPLAYYLADDARGRNAKRLAFPYPRPDGTMLTADALPLSLDIGWSSRANTSTGNNLGFLDPMRSKYPRGEFMLQGRFKPADRPDVEWVVAMWHVTNGNVSLAYWAEQTEKLPPDAPTWKHRYTIVIDKRPEK